MPDPKTVFYSDGLQFSCTQCHSCCRHDPGFVFLTNFDIKRYMNFFRLSRQDFLDKYCRIVDYSDGMRYSLREKSNYDCLFWENGCTTYEARPWQCRSYPFWDHILENRASWDNQAVHCPGMNQGKLRTREEIEAWALLRKNEPWARP
jgi:Fe-S-cluster containining protein